MILGTTHFESFLFYFCTKKDRSKIPVFFKIYIKLFFSAFLITVCHNNSSVALSTDGISMYALNVLDFRMNNSSFITAHRLKCVVSAGIKNSVCHSSGKSLESIASL